MNRLSPTRTFILRDGRVMVSLFGARPGNTNLEPKEILTIADSLGVVRYVLRPRPSEFNAVVCTSRKLRIREKLKARHNTIRLCTGTNADGVIVPAGSAFYIASGDCPTIIATADSGMTVTSHGGLNCLVDNKALRLGIHQSRPHRSVVDAIIERFQKRKQDISKLEVFITCGIGPKRFQYSCNLAGYSAYNTLLIKHLTKDIGRSTVVGKPSDGHIELRQIIRRQFMRYGVPSKNISWDDIDTATDLREDGQPVWYSVTRNVGTALQPLRNGVFVVRHY